MFYKHEIELTSRVLYISVNGFKELNETQTLKYICIQMFIVHIYLFRHDMKVRHRPVLDSGRRQIERLVCAVLQYLLCHCTWPSAKKTTLAVAVIAFNAVDSGKINNRQFCSHVCVRARIETCAPLLFGR